jgi:hypothetical protein
MATATEMLGYPDRDITGRSAMAWEDGIRREQARAARAAELLARNIVCFEERMGVPFVSTMAPDQRKPVRSVCVAAPPVGVKTRIPTLMSIPEQLDRMTDAITVRDAYTLLHMDRCTLYNHIRSGQIAAFWAGSRLRIDPHHLAAYVRSRESVRGKPPLASAKLPPRGVRFPLQKKRLTA